MFKWATRTKAANTKAIGDDAEARALAWLAERGLRLVQRNYRVARGPSARGGEIDLILRDGDGTLVFVEVRARTSTVHGGAAASISARKRARIVRTAQHYLAHLASVPPCRFDVVTIDGDDIEWLPAAFESA